MIKTQREIEAELLKQYITPELYERAKTDRTAFCDLLMKEVLAEIDSGTIYLAQFEANNGHD